MAATNFKTENNTYRKLIGNGLTYRIPRFQRDYSWDEDEWEDLWADILAVLDPDGESAHYMGYLVLQSKDDKNFDVIDGQQRLTTLSLIVLAVLRHLDGLVESGKDKDRNAQRQQQIRNSYIGYLDPVTLIPRSKLTLNRNNDGYYQNYLVRLAKQLPRRGFKASEHLLRKASEYFERRVAEYVKGCGGDEGVSLAKFVEALSDRLFFTVISVSDELNAYKVFETLNARGVRLSTTDLLKNYLFSIMDDGSGDDTRMNGLEGLWESLLGRLEAEDFPSFLRAHWISRRPIARQSELFKAIRSEVRDAGAAFELIRGLGDDLDLYLNLSKPEASEWPDSLKSSAKLLRLFNVRQPYPLLMAARKKLDDGAFGDLFRALVIISFRYNIICGQSPAEQEKVYNYAARRFFTGEVTTVRQALDAMRRIYPDDNVFAASFASKSIKTTQSRNKGIVRYILTMLENRLSAHEYELDNDSVTIEHVLPVNPEKGWDSFTDDEAASMVYRLGNMTLLTAAANRDLANRPFNEKQPLFRASPFRITSKIAEEHVEWNAARIEARQRQMAKMATSIWRLEQLS